MTTPYTYLIVHTPSGMKYYGVRYKQGCSPDDLWSSYFTSSKVIKALINKDGTQAFTYHVRRVFHSPAEAVLWEAKVHRRLRVDLREDWINQHAQSCEFRCKKHTDETKEKIRIKMKARRLTEQHKKRISEASLIINQRRRDVGWKMPTEDVERRAQQKRGVKRPTDVVDRMRESKKGTKRHYLPDGSFIMVKPQQDQ